MDLYEAIETRRSVRSYLDKPVDDEPLHRILEAARLAPSASNRQAWKFIVVRDPAKRQALSRAAEQPFIGQAPVVIAAVSLDPDRLMHCQVPSGPVDCAIALEHVALAAAAEGLGTCWIGHFNQDQCREALSVPPTAKIIELMPLGHPADAPQRKSRKPFDQVICQDAFK